MASIRANPRSPNWIAYFSLPDGRRTNHSTKLEATPKNRKAALANPAADLELPRAEKRLPRHVLTGAQAERVLGLPDVAQALGLRDRAILEAFYSTGMRRMELLGLKLYDLDQDRGTVFIRQGKGKKDRMIPMGDRAFSWVRRYLEEARPSLALTPDDGTVFLTNVGLVFEPNRLTQMVRDYVDKAETGKTGACHLFRHTCATLMLEGGADIRFIQQLLGHEKLETTQIYAQVSIRMLKEVHTRTHPARLTAQPGAGEGAAVTPVPVDPDAPADGAQQRGDGVAQRSAAARGEAEGEEIDEIDEQLAAELAEEEAEDDVPPLADGNGSPLPL